MSIDWGSVWQFLAPVLREALIAFLMAVLALLGYDRKVLPARLLTALQAMGFKVERPHPQPLSCKKIQERGERPHPPAPLLKRDSGAGRKGGERHG